MASLTAHELGAMGSRGNMMGKETPYTAGCFPEILCEGVWVGRKEGGREGREGGEGEEGGVYFTSELSTDCFSQQVDSWLFDWYGMAIENSPNQPTE